MAMVCSVVPYRRGAAFKLSLHLVCCVIIMGSLSIPPQCRFAFVEYNSHQAAATARRKLMSGGVFLWGHQLPVDWAEPDTCLV